MVACIALLGGEEGERRGRGGGEEGERRGRGGGEEGERRGRGGGLLTSIDGLSWRQNALARWPTCRLATLKMCFVADVCVAYARTAEMYLLKKSNIIYLKYLT